MTTLHQDFASFQLPNPEETAQIIHWLRAAGLDKLEITVGERSFNITLPPLAPSAIIPVEAPASPPKGNDPTPVKSPYFGHLSLLHPMGEEPLAPIGSHVKAGDTVALLAIGPMQISVTAPCAGTVADILAHDGELTGYGTTILTLIPSPN